MWLLAEALFISTYELMGQRWLQGQDRMLNKVKRIVLVCEKN